MSSDFEIEPVEPSFFLVNLVLVKLPENGFKKG